MQHFMRRILVLAVLGMRFEPVDHGELPPIQVRFATRGFSGALDLIHFAARS